VRLYVKTLVILFATLIAISAGIYLLSQATMGAGIQQMKEQEAQQNARRALSTITEEAKDMEKTCFDWAVSTDTYSFMKEQRETYISNRLNDVCHENLRLNYIIYLNEANQVVIERGYDVKKHIYVPVPESLHAYIASNPSAFSDIGEPDGKPEIVALPEGMLFLESHRILRSDETGPARGSIVMGRYLDEDLLSAIETRAYLTLSLYPAGDDTDPQVHALVTQGPPSQGFLTASDGEGGVVSYVPLVDFSNRPVGVMKVELPRSILAIGQGQLVLFITYFISIVLIFSIIALYLLGRTVISRIEDLDSQVNTIGKEGAGASRVQVRGKDEVTNLGNSINGMLESLQEKDTAIRTELERKNDFIHVAAHELRTPLQPLIGYIDLFLAMPDEFGLSDDVQKHLAICKESVDREHYIVDRMLQLSLVSDSHEMIRPEFATFSPRWLIRSILDMLPAMGPQECSIDIPGDLLLTTDRQYFFKIMETLLSNAVKFSSTPRQVRVEYRATPEMHLFSVRDNGVGIPKNALKDIFRPFYLIDGPKLSRMYDRLGLGLAISKKLAEKLHGEITVESEEGKGTTFTLAIPLQPVREETPAVSASPSPATPDRQNQEMPASRSTRLPGKNPAPPPGDRAPL
jgi:signal transduction histidine kinase